MRYKLANIGFSKTTNCDANLLSKVRETTGEFRERYIKTLQSFGSIDRAEEVIKEFIERCDADYQVDYVKCNAASENILIKIILNPYSNYPTWVNFLFYPAIEDELEDDANMLNGLLSGEDTQFPLKENSTADNAKLAKVKANMYTFYNGVSLKKKRRGMKEGVGDMDINNSIVETFEDIAEKYGLKAGFDYNEGGSGKVLVFSDCPLEDGVDIKIREELQSALPNYKVYSYVSGDTWFTRGVHKNEVTFVINYEMYENHFNKKSKLKEDEEKPLRSVRDFIGDYLSKKFTLCPPEVPNEHWQWSKTSLVKPGEDACLSCNLIASSEIQKILLDTTTDVVLKPNPNDISGDISIYVKLPDDIVNAIKALPEMYSRWGGNNPGKALEKLHFKEGYYMYFDMIRTGSHKKECMWDNFPYGIKTQTERYSEKDVITRMASETYDKYSISDVSYSVRPKVEEIGKMLYNYCMQKDFWGTVKDLMFMASDIWVQKMEEKKNEKLKKEQEAEAKKKAEKQSYEDWVKKGNPVYYRYGFAYKGAKARPISKREALTQIYYDKPFEYNWETINGEKALVLQQYSENDMW